MTEHATVEHLYRSVTSALIHLPSGCDGTLRPTCCWLALVMEEGGCGRSQAEIARPSRAKTAVTSAVASCLMVGICSVNCVCVDLNSAIYVYTFVHVCS